MTQKLARTVYVLFLLLPAVTLVVSYIMVAIEAGHPLPLFHVVHEDGIHTLIGTIFYFEHAAREAPIDIILGLTIGAASAFGFAPKGDAGNGIMWSILVVLTITVIIGGSLATVGLKELGLNLAQMHTRAGAPITVGAHWFYHFISRSALLLAIISVGLIAGSLLKHRQANGAATIGAVMAIFVIISLMFGRNGELVRYAFVDPVYLGHQAREFITHSLVSIPLAFAACMSAASAPDDHSLGRPGALGLVCLAVAVALAAYLGLASVALGSADLGQSSNIAVLIFPHFFEHSLGYLLTAATAATTYHWLNRRYRSTDGRRQNHAVRRNN